MEEDALALNELARLYPWVLFNQREIEVMMRLPRTVVSAAFKAPDVHAPFGRSRPERIMGWLNKFDSNIRVKCL